MLASASRAIICWFSRCFLVLLKPELFSYGNKKNPLNTMLCIPAQPDITLTSCHLQTFPPFLSFPSISEPGCQLTGKEPISQSRFLPFPPAGCPPAGGQRLQTPLPGCTSPQQPRSKGWYPGLPTLHPPKSRLLYFPCNSHQEGWDGRSGLQGGTLSPTPASQDALSLCNGYPRSQPRHAACSWWFRLRFLTPKK